MTMTMQVTGRNREIDDNLFDDTAGYEDETGVKVATNLTEIERKQAIVLYRLFNELWGVCLVTGDPGTGKDLFGNYLSYKIKRCFPWKRILRDERPRKLFGAYAGLFNEDTLAKDLAQMTLIAKGMKKEGVDKALDAAADDWADGAGKVLLKNSLLYLTEFWRYCYNRNPHNPMNKTMGAIHKVKRHLDCLIVGTGQLASELDKKTCLPWVDWQVTCTRSASNKTGFVYYVTKVKYDTRKDMFIQLSKPFPIAFDAGRPRTHLGDGIHLGEGKITIKKPGYVPENEEERVVLAAIKLGTCIYEDLVDLLYTQGDMEEWEVLNTLKELKFNKRKRVVDYPCYFGLYNSKSAQQIQTSLKEDK